MPRIHIRFFGPARDLAGSAELSLDVEDNTTLGQVAGVIAENFPDLGRAVGIRLAVNREYVALDRVLRDRDEVAVIPPVSGGSDEPRVRLTKEPIDVAALTAEMQSFEAGAVATFVGTVRAETKGAAELTALDYAAYEEMAVEQFKTIRRRAGEKFPILDAAIVHRIGHVPLGETSIAVIVVSAHRAGAFDALRFVVDAVKTDAPIWKKDHWSDGSESWVNAE
ncbi:MAG: molybdenum cofactor biosynthesis protein MoaE [Phycisphaerales bacterium]|nr:molybdenum cofactor biosynthesis protein MoaE [Phycisphaerales bacterium]MCB9862329.1 molybdenum cofactor biosynthesis protein MoaE [Phycisphaerales bacterium]